MNFERMDRRITLRELTASIDSVSGEQLYSPGTTHSVWAEFRALKGSEIFQSERELGIGNGVYIVRAIPGSTVTAKGWDLVDELGNVWDIVGEPRVIGRQDFLEIPVQRRS